VSSEPDRGPVQTIVLDPGHGGDDWGVQGAAGTTEKTIALDLARRLRSLLEARLGIRVLLTRDDDRTVGLDERAAFANNSKADLFVSIHANAGSTPAASGLEVLYAQMGQERGPSLSSFALPVVGGGDRRVEFVRWDLAQAPHVGHSAALAAALEGSLRQQIPIGVRGVRQLPLRVLSGVNMPAALIEIGYLSHPDEAALVATDVYQATIARGIADGLEQFRQSVDTRAR
jgi:N-acetylmuramoyl-L-alanine amidase